MGVLEKNSNVPAAGRFVPAAGRLARLAQDGRRLRGQLFTHTRRRPTTGSFGRNFLSGDLGDQGLAGRIPCEALARQDRTSAQRAGSALSGLCSASLTAASLSASRWGPPPAPMHCDHSAGPRAGMGPRSHDLTQPATPVAWSCCEALQAPFLRVVSSCWGAGGEALQSLLFGQARRRDA